MKFTIKGLYLNSSNEAVTTPTPDDDNPKAEDLKDLFPIEVKKTIANCRYAYDNDPTLQGIILNNATTANNKYRIEGPNEEVTNYIRTKAQEWDLDSLMTNTLIKVMRDGACFIEKAIVNGSIDPRFLSFDGDKYKFQIIRNPQSDKILGFKQKFKRAENLDNWETTDYDKLKNEMVDDEANFKPDQIIYPVLIESEGGKAKSLVMALLTTVSRKWTLEKFMISVAHKAGNLIGITIGNEKVANDQVNKSFVKKLIRIFRNPIEKDVAVMPHGVSADVIGNTTLPQLTTYLKYFRNEMFIALQTPETLFSSESSNRSTVEVQADDETGYKVFINFLRYFLKKYFEQELIDAELALQPRFKKYMGTVKIKFDEDETPQPLTSEKEAEKVAEESEVEEDTGTIPTSANNTLPVEA